MSGLSSSKREMTMNILDCLTTSLHKEIDNLEKNLFEKLDRFRKDNEAYNKFTMAHDGPLFSIFGVHLNEMLKDVKTLAMLKRNELATIPRSNSSIFFQKKNLKREKNKPSYIETDPSGNVNRVITPLTSNKEGYQLIEERDGSNGDQILYITSTADEIFSHERRKSKATRAPRMEEQQEEVIKEKKSPFVLAKRDTFLVSNGKSLSDFPEIDWNIDKTSNKKGEESNINTPETPLRKKNIVITSTKRMSFRDGAPDFKIETGKKIDFSDEQKKDGLALANLPSSVNYGADKAKSNNTISFRDDFTLMGNESLKISKVGSSVGGSQFLSRSKIEFSPMKLMKESYQKVRHTPSKSLQSSIALVKSPKSDKDNSFLFKSLCNTSSIPLKHKQKLIIMDEKRITVEDKHGKQLFSGNYFPRKVGINSGKSSKLVHFSKSKNECVFFTSQSRICILDVSIPGDPTPSYFEDEETQIVDFVIENQEERLILLNAKGNIFYKSLKDDFLAEDQSLMNLGSVKGRAITLNSDSKYLLIGYESDFFDGTHEDNLIIRKKSPISGYFEPFTAAYLSSLFGKNSINFFS